VATPPKPNTKPKAKTQQQRQAQKRKEALALIDQQIKDGTLTVRKMTAAERKKFPPKSPDKAKTAGKARSGARGRSTTRTKRR
jgi:hypothetical protein